MQMPATLDAAVLERFPLSVYGRANPELGCTVEQGGKEDRVYTVMKKNNISNIPSTSETYGRAD